MMRRVLGDKTSLRGAAATIFALTAILPLCVLVAFLWRSGTLADSSAQVNVLLALIVAILGFMLFQHLIRRIASVAEAMRTGAESVEFTGAGASLVPAIGRITEIGEITASFSRLLEELRTSTERLNDSVIKLDALNELAELAARIPSLDELLQVVLDRTMRTVRASIGSIMLLDAERQTLRIVASRGLTDVDGIEIRVGDAIAGKVVQLGEPVLVEDIESDPRFARSNNPKYGSGSFISVPVRARDRVIGVINLAKKQPGVGNASLAGAFSSTDLNFLTALMTNVGYAVDNARMLEESRQTATQLRQALDDVKGAQARLVQAETLRALGELASGMAHHLNNLLAVILGRVDLLLLNAGAQDKKRLDSVRSATMDAAEVVRRMLRFTERHRVSDREEVDLNALAEEVIAFLRPRWYDEAQLRGITVDVTLERGRIATTTGEVTALREVLMNLLTNAIEAVPKSGRIAVRTWTANDWVYCSISDSGIGMSEQLRAHAAEPFFTTKGPKGTGLGLSAAHGIIEQHGGELSIDSREGGGTTVTIRLPATVAVAPPPAPAPASAETVATGPLRILLIDDDAPVRNALVEALTSEHHQVVDVAGGREGLSRLERGEAFDLVLTDLGMPDISGWAVARAVKRRWPTLPVVLVTGWQELAEGTEDDRRAVDLMLAKPVTLDSLRAVTSVIRTARR